MRGTTQVTGWRIIQTHCWWVRDNFPSLDLLSLTPYYNWTLKQLKARQKKLIDSHPRPHQKNLVATFFFFFWNFEYLVFLYIDLLIFPSLLVLRSLWERAVCDTYYYIYKYTHVHTYIHTHSHTHTHTHTHTHKNTQKHKHNGVKA